MAAVETHPGNLTAALTALFHRAKLPTSPALAKQILDLANDASATVEQFAELIRHDANLSARILNVANAAFYAQRTPVTTIQRAVSLLGINRVRTIALGFQLIAHVGKLGGCEFDMKAFWRDTLLRGCLAREIADLVVPCHADEAFLVGLIQDCGILILVQLLGKPYAALWSESGLSPTAFSEAERRSFPYDHIAAIRVMAKEWRLPELIARPAAAHHRPTDLNDQSSPLDRLCAVAHLAGAMRLADQTHEGVAEPALADYAHGVLGLSNGQIEDCLRKTGENFATLVRLLPDSAGGDADATELLTEANRQLVRVADFHVLEIEAHKQESTREHMQLCAALGEYRERAARDPLTGLLNRGALIESLTLIMDRVRTRNQPLAVLFLDVDNFKALNDRYGHRAGDEVLQAIGSGVCELAVNDGCVARYGGEEIVLVMPDLSVDAARAAAEAVVARVRAIDYARCGLSSPVTCSVGAVWHYPVSGYSELALLEAADKLMYRAKRSGKNRFAFDVLRGAARLGASVASAGAVAVVDHALQGCQNHPPPPGQIQQEFREVSEELNLRAQQRFVNARKQERQPISAPCKLIVLDPATRRLQSYEAHMRNLSQGGVGLLTLHPIQRGQPVEIVISGWTLEPTHVAGLVAFCRHIRNEIYEVGIQLFSHSRQPILAAGGGGRATLDWIEHALSGLTSRDPPADPPPAAP